MSQYRKQKKVPALYSALDGGQARIRMSDLPKKAREDYCIYSGESELDVLEFTKDYIIVDTEGEQLEEVTVKYDEIEEPEEEKLDLAPLADAIKNVEDAIYATEAEDKDDTAILTALEGVKRAVEAIEPTEVPDYADELKRLATAIIEGSDRSEVLARLDALLIKETPVFEIPAKFISGDRIKVEVDRVSMGGGGSTTTSTGAGTEYTEGAVDATITGTAILFEGGSNTLRVPSDTYPLPVDITQGVDVQFGPGTIDSFGHLVTGTINNQVDIQFYRDTVANLTTVTTANGGSASATGGMATFSATTTANSRAQGVSPTTTTYTAGGEIYAIFTAGWTGTGAGTSYQRIGIYDANNGFFISKEANTFSATVRKGGVDVSTAKASFSEDTLVGGATSQFTRDGTPEAIDLTKLNVYRIRFGWVGSAPINFEVLAPDGHWVTFHKILQPNNAALPHIESADLPVTCDVNSGNGGNALTIITNCWAAGTTQALGKISATITEESFAGLQRAVITGETTAGGGGFVNVKVDPSGAVNVAGTVAVTLPNEGQQTMANSISVAIASNQTGVPVTGTFYQATQPVSGTVTATATDLDIRNLTATDVVTVTGGAGQTADVKVTLDGESVPVTGTFWQATQPVSGTFYQATQPVSATDLDIRNLAKAQDEVYAVLKTDAGVAYDARSVTVQNASLAVTGTFYQATQPVSLATNTPTLQANSGVDIGDVTINNASGASAVNIQDGGNTITVDGTVSANATLTAETTKVIGTVNVSTGQTITDVPATTGGLSKFHLVGAATSNATNVKNSAGQVYAISAFNVAATPAYLKFHNTSGTPTAGAGVTDTFLIPGNTSGAGVVLNIDKGIAFATGIGITLVTGIADADTTAIAASNVVCNIYYK